jgi:hypothetical protein
MRFRIHDLASQWTIPFDPTNAALEPNTNECCQNSALPPLDPLAQGQYAIVCNPNPDVLLPNGSVMLFAEIQGLT